MYYHITAFGGSRDIQGFSGPWGGGTFHYFRPCQTSAGAQVHHLKQSSPNPSSRSTLYPLLILLTPPSNSFIVLFPSVYPSSSICNPTLIPTLNPFLFNAFTIPSAPLPSSHLSPTFPLKSSSLPLFFSFPPPHLSPSNPVLVSFPAHPPFWLSSVIQFVIHLVIQFILHPQGQPMAILHHPLPPLPIHFMSIHPLTPIPSSAILATSPVVYLSVRHLRVYSFACFTSIKELIIWSSPRSSNVVAQPRSNVVT